MVSCDAGLSAATTTLSEALGLGEARHTERAVVRIHGALEQGESELVMVSGDSLQRPLLRRSFVLGIGRPAWRG